MPPKKPVERPAAKPATKRASKPAASRAAPKRIVRACGYCGVTASCAEGGLPQGWTIGAGRAGVEYMCDDCARRNIRAIEGKLPQEWWE